MSAVRLAPSYALVALLSGCSALVATASDGGATDGATADMRAGGDSGAGTDSGPDVDSGSGSDSGPLADSGPGADSGPLADSGPGADSGMSCAGIECSPFPPTFVRGCTNDDSCVGELHQIDCCGAIHVMGMNHSEAMNFCSNEYGTGAAFGCRMRYPAMPGCSSSLITTDTGATTMSMTNIAARCADIDPTSGVGTCTTFVCGTAGGAPCPSTRHIGTCSTGP